jgi:hypothetical protein
MFPFARITVGFMEVIYMSHMTNAQIDELNMLLAEHESALIAFYKEGMDQGAKNVFKGIPMAIGIVIGVQVIEALIKRHKKQT